jgi:hypothetical protein
MKRVLIGLMVLIVALSLAGAALAAGPKVPKSLCLDFLGSPISLIVKNQGSLKTTTVGVKMYSINGVWLPGTTSEVAVAGTGFVGTDGLFHFSFGGTFRGTATIYYVLGVTGQLNLTLGTGTLDFAYMKNTGSNDNVVTSNRLEVPCTVVDCTTVVAPLSEKVEADPSVGPNPAK